MEAKVTTDINNDVIGNKNIIIGNSRKFLVEKFQQKTKIPYKILFFLGLFYLYFLEFFIAQYFLHISFSNEIIYGIVLWIFLWVFALGSMFHIRKKSYTTIDRLKENGFYNDLTAKTLKDKLLNYQLSNSIKIKWKTIFYITLSILLFTGITYVIFSWYTSNSNFYWLFNTSEGTRSITEPGILFFISYNMLHWGIAAFLSVFLFDIVVIMISLGMLTYDVLERTKGKLDFYNPDGFAGLHSIGELMSSAIFIYFVSLSIFSLLMGYYQNIYFFGIIGAAWIIGIILIVVWQLMVRNVIRNGKKKSLKEVVKKIKDLEKKKVKTSPQKMEKILNLSSLHNQLSIIKNTDENIFNFKTTIYPMFPIVTTLGNYLINFLGKF